ncbi:MAG: ABC transporter ATP-binding protein [Desulfarculaceae bacterium]|nr:ABC transporter ATP-binding protein [Desulfarculaceae bacterium]MCF8046328.1 ABC transporter ATP-binding protein [Desulfarculaceae bacterium]MCF8063698.1 ABC transporter ATP-binding protein [Desulfarculaceae bacterium]MCF8098330.1 ABC transporter ATP-binding protein [Desulfarculaceae bacterium]MCF8121604.1 ABC transporter ATP-binding protein [Desulfarculaceae bacterium]
MIKLKGITKTYYRGKVETPVLLGIDLHVRPGEFLAIMGPSGSGKSTLLHILGLLDRPTGGSYRLDGSEVSDLSDDELARLRNDKLGFVFQAFHLLPKSTALDNVLLPFTYAGHFPEDARERARRALGRVGLEHRLHHRPGEMSGGECQRVAIARALVNDPEVIFADEPTGNLDQRSSLEIISILQGLHAEGRTIVLVTHDTAVGCMCRRLMRVVYGNVDSDEAVAEPTQAIEQLQTLKEAAK